MKQVLPVVIFVAACIMSACNSSPDKKSEEGSKSEYAQLDKASWLIGTWKNESAEGSVTETWQKQSDSSYSGTSSFNGREGTSNETIVLTQRGDQLLYIPTVSNQNEGQPVTFTSTSISDKELVFENPSHDFPQKISYRQITADSLVAEVSGVIDGKPGSQAFSMKKK